MSIQALGWGMGVGDQLVLQEVQGHPWTPFLVYLDHPLVLILFVAFHVHLKRRLGVGGEGPQPPSQPQSQILPLAASRVSVPLAASEVRDRGPPPHPCLPH